MRTRGERLVVWILGRDISLAFEVIKGFFFIGFSAITSISGLRGLPN